MKPIMTVILLLTSLMASADQKNDGRLMLGLWSHHYSGPCAGGVCNESHSLIGYESSTFFASTMKNSYGRRTNTVGAKVDRVCTDSQVWCFDAALYASTGYEQMRCDPCVFAAVRAVIEVGDKVYIQAFTVPNQLIAAGFLIEL